MNKDQADASEQDANGKPDGEKGESSSPTKVQDLTKVGREDFDPNDGQE